MSKQASFLLSQLFKFPSIVLTVLGNDAAKGETRETTEYKISKAIIQNHFCGTCAVPPVWGALEFYSTYVVPLFTEVLISVIVNSSVYGLSGITQAGDE